MNAFTKQRGIVAVRANANLGPVLAELNEAFGDFKNHQGARVDEIHARLDEIEKLAGRLPAGGSGRGGDVDAAEVANFFAAVRRQSVDPASVSPTDAKEYQAAFASYLKVGDAVPTDIKAAMQIGSDPDGGYWSPPALSQEIKRRLFETSPMRQAASVMTIQAPSIKFPVDVNDATTGGWVGETASRSDTATPEIGEQEIFLREQYAQPKATQRLIDLGGFDVEDWLTGKIVDKLTRTENTAFVNGDGVNQPRGFLDYSGDAVTTDDASRDWGVLQYVPSGAAGAFPDASGISGAKDPDALIDLQMALKPQYRANAMWMMNRATAGVVRKLKDADGRYIWNDSLVQGQPPMLLGSGVVLAEDMPDIGSDSFSIAYGDFAAGYQIIDGPSLRILRDPFTNKPYVRFYTTKYVGGDVTDFDAIKLLKFSAS